MNASRHDSLDEGSNVLVLHRAFDLTETRTVRAVVHGLILQIAFATLIANGAGDEQKKRNKKNTHHNFSKSAHRLRFAGVVHCRKYCGRAVCPLTNRADGLRAGIP